MIKKELNKEELILDAIAKQLLEYDESIPTNNLMGGKIGYALFFFYYYNYSQQSEYLDKCFEILTESINNPISSNQNANNFSFAGGAAGLGWLLQHLSRFEEFEFDGELFFEELDKRLFEELKKYLSEDNLDFFYGASGICWYFIKTNKDNRHGAAIRYFLDYLIMSKIDDHGKCFWISKNGKEKAEQKVNLGIAHGMPSLVLLLCGMTGIEALKVDASSLLKPALDFLDSIKLDTSLNTTYYPYTCEYKEGTIVTSQEKSRLAWCYGDLGIAWTFFKGGLCLKDEYYLKLSHQIVTHSSKRKDFKEDWVFDAMLCHGAAGISMMLQKMNNHFKDDEIDASIDFWKNVIFRNENFGSKSDEYFAFNSYFNEYQVNGSFLEGKAGLGLVMISILSGENPDWSDCLMLD